ncbi:alpha/beta-hydrolase [Peniophora sp. CONT]|nr:alpha/beta-hydrolase [Peniophora sp. CONT]
MQFISDVLPDLAARTPLSRNADVNLSPALTPKDLLELPSVGSAVPNVSGTLLFVIYSKWSHDTDTESCSLQVSSIAGSAAGSQTILLEIDLPAGEAFWFNDTTLVVAVPDSTEHTTSLYACNISQDSRPERVARSVAEIGELIGALPTDSAGHFRYSPSPRVLVFTARVFSDGNLVTAVAQDRAWSERKDTARVYDGQTYLRHWNQYGGPMHSALFSTSLSVHERKWQLGDTYVNLLKGTYHKVPATDSPGPDFDVSDSQVVYTTKDTSLREAFHTKKNVFLVDLNGRSPPQELTIGDHGGTSNPIFSPDGKCVAWLEIESDGAFDAKNYVVLYDTKTKTRFTLLQGWDRSPSSIAFSSGSHVLYLTAPEIARVKIFAYPLFENAQDNPAPITLTHTGEATDLHALSDGRLLYTHTTLTSPGSARLLSNLHDISNPSAIVSQEVASPSVDALGAPREYSRLEEFWFEGDSRKVQGYLIKPRGWTASKKWPVVLLIHGGPQWLWGDSWSDNFNTQIFSEQGYFVVAINPSGSTSFGQECTDAVTGDWGGAPLRDIAKGFKGVLKEYTEIDPKRAFAFGGSYGGYMINLLQGQARGLGLQFAAMASLCGIFNTEYLSYTMDELFVMRHDWRGWPWEKQSQSIHDALSPHKFVQNWEIPQLVMHGDLDFRVPVTERIATFNALQQRGVPSRLLIFEKESHVFENRNNVLIHFNEVFAWFERFARVKDAV